MSSCTFFESVAGGGSEYRKQTGSMTTAHALAMEGAVAAACTPLVKQSSQAPAAWARNRTPVHGRMGAGVYGREIGYYRRMGKKQKTTVAWAHGRMGEKQKTTGTMGAQARNTRLPVHGRTGEKTNTTVAWAHG